MNVLSVVIGLVLFGAFYLAFRIGLRMGAQTARGIPPEALKSPLKAIKDIKTRNEQEKKVKTIEEGIESIFSYTGGK